MKIFSIKINSFRDIKDATININEMVNFIVSDNNVGKTRVKSYKLHKVEAVPREEWVRVENTHESIIDK